MRGIFALYCLFRYIWGLYIVGRVVCKNIQSFAQTFLFLFFSRKVACRTALLLQIKHYQYQKTIDLITLVLFGLFFIYELKKFNHILRK